MDFTQTISANIHASTNEIWGAINHGDFVRQFLPEIKKIDTESSLEPDFKMPHQVMRWKNGIHKEICIPRKDLNIDIQSIVIEIQDKGDFSRVSFRVLCDLPFNFGIFNVIRVVRGLFRIKLNVLKSDMKAQKEILRQATPCN